MGTPSRYWIINGDSPSLIGPMEGLDLWYFVATRIEQDPEDIDPKDLIRRATPASSSTAVVVVVCFSGGHLGLQDGLRAGRTL